MALTYTTPANIDFDPESVDTVITNTFATAASSTFANSAGGFATGAVQLDVALTYDQDFIATDTAHPDSVAGDLTVQAVFTEDDGTVTRTTIANGASATTIGTLGSSGNHTVGFEVTGLEEGCELSIIYNIDNNSDTKTGNITEIGVESVKGLNDCDFQDVLKYQQLNQKLNNRFDADTKEFSSFKDMLKRMKKVK
tara:strand:+ start:205 stop:792 length:588 start_codon:yes stop_codon:yes gene_type:complete